MPEKEYSPVAASDVPAADGSTDLPGGAQPEAGGPETVKATFSQKVKSLVDDFVDYAKKTDL